MNIQKKMTHIWIGPKTPPMRWMYTWQEKHPDWEYSVFTDDMLKKRKWYNQHLIEEYYRRGTYAGVADLIRYELIYERGGFWPEADAECLNRVDELFVSPEWHAYSVYENEVGVPNFISPIMAANPGNRFLDMILRRLHELHPSELDAKPHISTGNQFLSQFVEGNKDKLTIFPSHYFIPQWFKRGWPRYSGPDKIYAEQHWGSTGVGLSVSYDKGV